jgi:glyoxylase-like metal-dependent hydrolase (beta-lactamase superfamily II)
VTDAGGDSPHIDDYVVVVVRHGTWTTTRARAFLHPGRGGRPDEPYTLDYYFWVVRNGRRSILVDTGFSADEALRRGRTPTLDVSSALTALGFTPDWAGDVVLTHCHYDHTGHLDSLPRARIHMSASEYTFWLDSSAGYTAQNRSLACPSDIDALRRADRQGRLIVHSGDHHLAPGIALLLAPGHTPGQLMVRINTRHGPVLLTSDAAHFDEEYLHDRPFHHMTDLRQAAATYAAIRRMRDDGAHIVTGHQCGLLDRYPAAEPPLDRDAVMVGQASLPL